MFLFELFSAFGLVLILSGFFFIVELWNGQFTDRYMTQRLLDWFIYRQEAKFYKIILPTENIVSISSMENFFNNVHSIYSLKSNKDIFIKGKWHENVVFEIHSKGGKISFVIKVATWYENLIKSSLQAQFPGARLVEIPDPLTGWPQEWTNKTKPMQDIFSTDIVLKNHESYPIKHYSDFQPDGEETTTDPMKSFINFLEGIDPKDHAIFQLIVRPRETDAVTDGWQEELDRLRTEYLNNSFVETDETGQIQSLTESEKKALNSITQKMGSTLFMTKIRFSYMTGDGKRPSIVENKLRAFMQQFTTNIQELTFEFEGKTNVDSQGNYLGLLGPFIAKFIDEHYWIRERVARKQRQYRGMFRRSGDVGSFFNINIFDSASLASLFHFPITHQLDSSLKAKNIASDYGESDYVNAGTPPSDLPV